MPLILGTNSIKDTGYDVANSLRFNDDSSDYLQRTPSSTGNRRTFTLSAWVKIGEAGETYHSNGTIFGGGTSSSAYLQMYQALNKFVFLHESPTVDLKSTALLRDHSAWYHLITAVDTTQSTESNRIKMYINGTQVTSFSSSTYPSQNADLYFGQTELMSIGTLNYTAGFTDYFDGYMAEVVYIDGQQLDPTSFGEFDSDSPTIWKPIDVSGLTFGTNGFYLDFENSGSLGADVSGNSNNFTVNNLTSVDQSTDTCTHNFTTLNPLATTTTQGTVSEGNLEFDRAGSSDGWVSILSTIGASAGKYYAEIKIIDVGSPSQGCVLGFLNLDETNIMSSSSTYLGAATADAGMGWYSVGNVFRQGGHVNIINSYTDNDIVMLAMDLDNGYCYFGKNGSWENSGDPTSGSSGTGGYATSNMTANGTYCFAVSCREAGNVQMNFGSPPYSVSSGNADANGYGNFEYAPPSGYYTLNTKNLAEFG